MSAYVNEYYGCYTFSDDIMKQRLSPDAYAGVRKVIDGDGHMTIELANVVAEAIKQWAVELGATHYTHWFQPMTGATAEKHEAMVSPTGTGGVLFDFSGLQLIKGEADASSFPSGGLRATFEARGYTTWDCTSPPFVRRNASGTSTLCIPTAFCSFTGEALDEKTPLLRSMEALSRESVRVLKHLDVNAACVKATVGGEQEYFLVDKQMYKRRKDLVYCGRTLFGAPPAKGQELEDQYYASMSERVTSFMDELNRELWLLGVPAKTQHYEAAPAQYELAPMFSTANIATDHNQLVMEMLRKVADRHGFACLLHEKPFKGVNGSGKHNNWSLSTDTGYNLLKPGKNTKDNLVFLTFFIAVISAVDEYASTLNMSCASLSNDYRLGGNEAPPSIISVFTGSKLYSLLENIEKGFVSVSDPKVHMDMGVMSLPVLHRDDADRNRTSPFAFTGNKFEFRMCGSAQSLGLPNTVLNTIVAEQLRRIADRLDTAKNINEKLALILRELVRDHKKVIFNGNNYTQSWEEEARKRGLPIIKNAVEAVDVFAQECVVQVFSQHNVLSPVEMESRREIGLKSYIKHATIEAKTSLKMSKQKILPACIKYSRSLAEAAGAVVAAGCDASTHKRLLEECCICINEYDKQILALECTLQATLTSDGDTAAIARLFAGNVLPCMEKVRACADKLEKIVDKEFWPLPSYGEMMFYIV